MKLKPLRTVHAEHEHVLNLTKTGGKRFLGSKQEAMELLNNTLLHGKYDEDGTYVESRLPIKPKKAKDIYEMRYINLNKE
jgi:hypothetical protein